MAGYSSLMTARTRLSAGVLIAAAGSLLTPVIAPGTTAAPVKINTKTHTVSTGKFHIQFGNSTTDAPNDPERIDSLTWKDSHGTVSGNLATRGGSICGDSQEFWGQSYGSTEGQTPFLVVAGSAGTWTSPAAGQVLIKTNTPTTCGADSHIPITTN